MLLILNSIMLLWRRKMWRKIQELCKIYCKVKNKEMAAQFLCVTLSDKKIHIKRNKLISKQNTVGNSVFFVSEEYLSREQFFGIITWLMIYNLLLWDSFNWIDSFETQNKLWNLSTRIVFYIFTKTFCNIYANCHLYKPEI